MDYIREELLRQRTVLARLLLGQGAEEKAQEQDTADAAGEYPELSEGADVFWASRRLAAGETFQSPSGAVRTAEAESWDSYRGFAEDLPDAELRRERGGEWTGPSPVRFPSAGGEEMTGYRWLSQEGNKNRRSGSLFSAAPEDTLPAERTVTETVWADSADETGAKELSRVFQRDARRYDGGFILY